MHIKDSTKDGHDQYHTLPNPLHAPTHQKGDRLQTGARLTPAITLVAIGKKKAEPLACLSRRRGSVTSLAEHSPFGKEQDCCGKLAADCTRQGGIDANGTAPKIDQWNN